MNDVQSLARAPKDNNRNLRAAVTAVGLVLAALHSLHARVPWLVIDSTTIILLVVAAVPWLQPLLKSIELLGVKFELQELKETVQQQTRSIQLIEDSAALPGSSSSKEGLVGSEASEADASEDAWDTDPHKGKFGLSPRSGDRVLEAVITPATDERSAACHVVLTVRSTNPGHPLAGKVTFFLHPSFGRWSKYDVDVKDGIATDSITSWGVFTVGAAADRGATKLELDLASVPGGTQKFYRS